MNSVIMNTRPIGSPTSGKTMITGQIPSPKLVTPAAVAIMMARNARIDIPIEAATIKASTRSARLSMIGVFSATPLGYGVARVL